MAELVVLGLGSNRCLDEKSLSCEQVLREAVFELEKIFLPHTRSVSSIYLSRAMYYENQQDFYNMAVCGQYEESPQKLLEQVNRIEAKFGRDRSKEFRNGPRSLDIDIELFGNQIIDTENLQIPHKKLKERQFVLIPLLEILPECAEPINGTLFKDILKELPDQGVRLYKAFV